MLHHAQQARIAAKLVLAEVCAALDEEFLILPVSDFPKSPYQQTVAVILDQAVPIAAPDDFDYIPACATENCFQLLNDLSIAAHRTIEPLQVAVDHPDQVIELFTGSQRD